ncbi:hypothetical protein [Victivallis vadensis]|uniref:Uncharacterized protein n=1 Tax=Victivallis vadensis TaxID=172901 RepID=A0A2U1B6U8_9BACT|nr:hypothetical protein [Victivallis vadensis]PVY44247.1 hypothetical protein C8D82_1072 [Victivallis vadensis]
MSFIDWCDEEVIWEWKTNKFFIKEDKKEETLNWLKALEIVFNDGDFSFEYHLDPYNQLTVWGKGYEFRMDEEVYDPDNDDEVQKDIEEIVEDLFDLDYDDIESEYSKVIKDNVEEIVDAVTDYMDNMTVTDFLKNKKMNIDVEKTKLSSGDVPKIYVESFQDGCWDMELK